MNVFYLDASALIKYYTPEPGSDLVKMLLDSAARYRVSAAIWTFTEAAAALNRKKNAASIPEHEFPSIIQELAADFDTFHLQKANTEDARQSVALIFAHNLNATDALHLYLALELHKLLTLADAQVVLVTADARLVRAAQAEGLAALNPETATPTDLQALL
ncbi:MAG: type II toxin-antitoxin system VapC family toxin [Anaerolineae bacterium]